MEKYKDKLSVNDLIAIYTYYKSSYRTGLAKKLNISYGSLVLVYTKLIDCLNGSKDDPTRGNLVAIIDEINVYYDSIRRGNGDK